MRTAASKTGTKAAMRATKRSDLWTAIMIDSVADVRAAVRSDLRAAMWTNRMCIVGGMVSNHGMFSISLTISIHNTSIYCIQISSRKIIG